MAEPGQSVHQHGPVNNTAARAGRLKVLPGYEEPPALLAAGEALPGLQLNKHGNHTLRVVDITVPADAHLVLLEVAGRRPDILVEVGSVKVQAVDVVSRVFSIGAADLPEKGMGKADTELQYKLMGTYLKLLNEHDYLPAAICFYTEGVKLAVDGSPFTGELQALEAKGIRMILCGTCLNYFGLQEKVQIGILGAMTDIIEAQWQAKKVITI